MRNRNRLQRGDEVIVHGAATSSMGKVKAAYPANEVRLGGDSTQELAFFGIVQKVLADLNVTRVLVITIDSGGRQSDIPALQLADDSFTDLRTRDLKIIRTPREAQRWTQ